MTIAPFRPTRFWMPIAFALTTAVSTTGIPASSQGTEWDSIRSLIEEVKADFAARNHTREPLGGKAVKGHAWDNYQSALNRIPKSSSTSLARRVSEAQRLTGDKRRLETEYFTHELRFEIEAVQKGARCCDATPPLDWSKRLDEQAPSLMRTTIIIDAMTLAGIAEIESGAVDSGCAKILDALQFGEDLTRSPLLINQMIGSSHRVPNALREFLASEGLRSLPSEALQRLEAGYATLTERAIRKPEFRGDAILFAQTMLSLDLSLNTDAAYQSQQAIVPQGKIPEPSSAEIRDGIKEMIRAYRELNTLKGSDYRNRALGIQQEWDESSNPVLNGTSRVFSAMHSHRHSIVRAMLVRHALRSQLNLPQVPFADPFGKPLSEKKDGDHLVLSVENGKRPIELRVRR